MVFNGFFKMRRNGYSGVFFIGLVQFAMGVQLLLPGDTMEGIRTYRIALEIASPLGWGAFLIFSSTMLLVSAYRRRPREVAASVLPAAAAFFILFATYAAANPSSLQVPVMLILCIRCLSINREFTARQDDPHLTEGH